MSYLSFGKQSHFGVACTLVIFALGGCSGDEGKVGPAGAQGAAGTGCTATDNLDGTYTVNCGGADVVVSDGATGDGCTVVDNLDGTYDVDCGGAIVTVADGTDVDPEALAQLEALAAVEGEACAVCHEAEGAEGHQAIYDMYTDDSDLGLTITGIASSAQGTGECTTLIPCTTANQKTVCKGDQTCDDTDSEGYGFCDGEFNLVKCTFATQADDCIDGTCENLVKGKGTCTGELATQCADGTCEDGNNDGYGLCENEYEVEMTVAITKDGAASIATKKAFSALAQKRFYAVTYDSDNGTFDTSYSFSAIESNGDGTFDVGTFRAAPHTTELQDAILYAYVADGPLDAEGGGHIHLYDNVASAGLSLGTATSVDYESLADVSGCEKCHGAPYMKHGYRAAVVDGLPGDFAACKTCHYDPRDGGHEDWQILVDDPELYLWVGQTGDDIGDLEDAINAAAPGATRDAMVTELAALKVELDDVLARYPYKATVMNDTHMSHAMEFAYPQSMSTCATCHETNLTAVLDDGNFTKEVCRSCHAQAGSQKWVSCATIIECEEDADCTDGSCDNMVDGEGFCVGENTDLVECEDNADCADNTCDNMVDGEGVCTGQLDNDCDDQTCDNVTAGIGVCVNEDVYGTREHSLEQLWFNAGVSGGAHTVANLLDDGANDCNFCHTTGTGLATTMLSDLHNGGYDKEIYTPAADGTKWSTAFVVSVETADFDTATNILNVTFKGTETGTNTANVEDIEPQLLVALYGYESRDFIVNPHDRDANRVRLLEYAIGGSNPRFSENAAAAGSWDVDVDLTMWEAMIADGTVKRVEIGVMPVLEIDGDEVALDAPSKTFDLVTNAFDVGRFPDFVDVEKCNVCHDALATTFHSGKRGGSIVVCRMCHTPDNDGSHMEMQSRDSYYHAVHAFQPFDTDEVDFKDPVAVLRYEHHIASTFPNFTIKNCEACHYSGTYEVSDPSVSLPGALSSSYKWNVDRNIGNVPGYVTGPAAEACGGCHRAYLINEDDAAGLAALNAHTGTNGYLVEAVDGLWDAIVKGIMSIF